MGNCISVHISCDGNFLQIDEIGLEALLNTMQELKEKRDDVVRRVSVKEDEGLLRLAQVQEWLSCIEGVESQVNDLLEARSTQTKRLGLCGYSSKGLISGRDYDKKVLKHFNEVKGLLSNGGFEVVAEKIPAPIAEKKQIQTTVGLDRRVDSAWSCLMNRERKFLGLHGAGGIGKTTLLAGINNKFLEVVNEFDVVIWVVVSKNLQYEGIQDQILRRLGYDKECEQETVEGKSYKIYDILKGKKFVLLLDDLWSKIDLNKVGVPPVTQQNGSKIVLTTRLEDVCKDMEVDNVMEVVRLSPDEAWELFQKQLGESTLKSHPEIPTLARVVASICHGLPLALNAIGKSMACKMAVQEWSHAIDALVLSNGEYLLHTKERIFPLLKFSYDSLKDEKVKLCFLYCSLFPEDYALEKEELIEYWICEGFIDGNRDEDGASKEGNEIIDLLVSSHLLVNGMPTVKMHDVVRDVAIWIATNCGKHKNILCSKSGMCLHQTPKDIPWELIKKMSLMSNQITEISCSPNCPNLSTLLLQNNKLVHISGEFFRSMPALVVLDLSENKMLIGLPENITNLGSLQYLNLSHTGIKSLPVGLKELRRLIVLNLEFTTELESIVGIVTSLRNLQVLKLFSSGVCIDERLMEELQLLEHLKILTATVKDAAVLESIQGVSPLANSIRGLCLKNISAPVVILNTVALASLQIFAIMMCKISDIKIDWESKQRREGLPCTSSLGFKHLSVVNLINLEGPRDLTWLLFAQNLRDLSVMHSSSIEEIINREKGISICNAHPSTGAPLKKLEFLKLSELDELKIICGSPRAPPNLRRYIVRGCPKLPLSFRDMQWYNGGRT